jgi:hypothetical protein
VRVAWRQAMPVFILLSGVFWFLGYYTLPELPSLMKKEGEAHEDVSFWKVSTAATKAAPYSLLGCRLYDCISPLCLSLPPANL